MKCQELFTWTILHLNHEMRADAVYNFSNSFKHVNLHLLDGKNSQMVLTRLT